MFGLHKFWILIIFFNDNWIKSKWKKLVESRCILGTIWKNLEWLEFDGIFKIIFRSKVHEILNYELIFTTEISNKLEKLVFGKKFNLIVCSHLEKTCLPCNSRKISFHIWIFKNWIYTLHNNVHMLSSPYIYVMGSHLDQSCMPHYLPCKTMFICWVHTMLGKCHILKIPLNLVFFRIELVL